MPAEWHFDICPNDTAQSPLARQRLGFTNLKHSAIAVFLVQHTSKPPLAFGRFLFSAATARYEQRNDPSGRRRGQSWLDTMLGEKIVSNYSQN
jgi:hypothetical protein